MSGCHNDALRGRYECSLYRYVCIITIVKCVKYTMIYSYIYVLWNKYYY